MKGCLWITQLSPFSCKGSSRLLLMLSMTVLWVSREFRIVSSSLLLPGAHGHRCRRFRRVLFCRVCHTNPISRLRSCPPPRNLIHLPFRDSRTNNASIPPRCSGRTVMTRTPWVVCLGSLAMPDGPRPSRLRRPEPASGLRPYGSLSLSLPPSGR